MNTIVLMEMYGEGWVRKNDLRAMLAKLAPLGFAEVPKHDDDNEQTKNNMIH